MSRRTDPNFPCNINHRTKGGIVNQGRTDLAGRKPTLLRRLPGLALPRLAARQPTAKLFHEPPRYTRREPAPGPCGLFTEEDE